MQIDDYWSKASKKYCPQKNDQHFFYIDYNKEVSSWYSLAIYMCNPDKRALIGKTCKFQDEIEEYFGKTIVWV